MAVNMYDQAAEMPILNTYVPIDFGELYKIAAIQKDEIDKANEQLTTNLRKFGEFVSPSDIDTENYYKYSINQFQDELNEIANNPDALKDAGFRARLNQKFNNLDYATLSRLKQGAENLKLRNTNAAEMKAKGLYNYNWDVYEDAAGNIRQFDASNYDTLSEGILDQLSPIQYKTLGEIVKPYVDGIKPTFYAGNVDPNTGRSLPFTKGYQAITRNELSNVLDKAYDEILATPQGRMWYRDIYNSMKLANPQVTEQDALEVFKDAVMRDASYKLVSTPIDDEFAMKLALQREELRMKNGQAQDDQGNLLNRTQMLLADSQISRISNFTNLSNQKIVDFLQNGFSTLTENEQYEIMKANTKEYRSKVLVDNWLPLLASGLTPYQATDAVSDMLRSPMSSLSANDYAKINTTGKQDSDGYYKANTTRNFELVRELVYDEMGHYENDIFYWDSGDKKYKQKPGGGRVLIEDADESRNQALYYDSKAWQVLTDIWNRPNSISDFKVSPVPSQITTEKGNFAEQMALIPYEALREEFLKASDVTEQNVDTMLRTLGNFVQIDEPQRLSTTIKRDYRGNIDSSTESASTQSSVYIQIPVGTKIQTRGEAAVTPDAMYTKERLSSSIRDSQNAKSERENYGIQ